jgi:hypothetical protein
MIDANGTEGKFYFAKNLSVSTQCSVKLIKDYKTNTHTKTNNKLQTENSTVEVHQ